MDSAQLLAIPVFAGLDETVRAVLAGVVSERTLTEGERVFTEGDPGDTLYAIASGMIRIEKQVVAGEPASKTLSLLTRGELFGEMSVIDSQPRSASAVAAEPSRLFCVPRAAFEALLRDNPPCAAGLLFSVMRSMNERIRRLNTSVVAYDEVGRAIGACEQITPLLEQVLRQLLPATGASLGVVFLKSEFHRAYEPRAVSGLTTTSTAVPPEHPGDPASLVASVADSAEGRVITDRPQDPGLARFPARPWEPRSLILAPIRSTGGILGVLALGHPAAGHFDVNHLNLAEGIARQTAQAIVNLRHREEQQSRARLGRQFVKF